MTLILHHASNSQWPSWTSDPPYLHLTFLEGVIEALPLGPVDAIAIGEVGPTKVEAIEVGDMTGLEPPST